MEALEGPNVSLGKTGKGANTDDTLWNQPEGAGLNAIAKGLRRGGRLVSVERTIEQIGDELLPKKKPCRTLRLLPSVCRSHPPPGVSEV